MPHYIFLIKWTSQGMKDVRDSPQRLEATRELARKWGGNLEAFYYTNGPYDLVAIGEAPNDDMVYQFVMMIQSRGNARIMTMRAWTPEEATKLLPKT